MKNTIKDLDRKTLEDIVAQSLSFSDVLRKINLSTNGGSNHRYLRERIKKERISTSHFKPWESAKKTLAKNRIPLNQVLINNAKGYASSHLKKRLVEEGLLKDQCNKCGLLPTWNGKILSLQLEHINGDHFDNRIENLEILCPNCHTQTLTYGSKRRKKIRSCVVCGKTVSKGSSLCRQCAADRNEHIHIRKVKNRPSLEVLLDEVEKMGYCAVGRKYEVSDNAIRKWIKNYMK